jgi:hypothetical protein
MEHLNLLIKSHVGSYHPCSDNSQVTINYKSLVRTEDWFEMLETFLIFSNVQPQLQPLLTRVLLLPRIKGHPPSGPD